MEQEKVYKTKISSNEIELVDFRISEEVNGEIYEGIYGINVAKVQEIIQMPETFDLPASPDYVIGVFDLRGVIIPLIDLAIWLKIKEREAKLPLSKKRVVIAEFNNLKIGFLVHEAKLIRRISWDKVQAAQFSSNSHNLERGKITGTTHIEDGKTLLILDLEGIIDDLDFYADKKNKKELQEVRKKFSGNVLIVDDSTIARSLLKKNLHKMGFTVIEAHDGEMALNMLNEFHKEHPNMLTFLRFIVSDIEMPKMDGFHFAESVKNDERFQAIPLIFNSSICDKFSEQKGRDIGADAYLVKFDAQSFYEEISKILE
ncbi:fused signal transduction protein/response regulator [Helicobacter didelphidarum]|uniref:Fused signal transduction protein/response regulator n=1 Tax=Helicobacter didelphidarum TaxID=2040648 RepID=A0A3D8IM04_9HELI|nr:chemotaxis protein [Helicobacter didelphidarum]RDU65985.1 fused signal transduction protein/response regulator [Helicobacter didelphidarum]